MRQRESRAVLVEYVNSEANKSCRERAKIPSLIYITEVFPTGRLFTFLFPGVLRSPILLDREVEFNNGYS